jgi:hypothetical protein
MPGRAANRLRWARKVLPNPMLANLRRAPWVGITSFTLLIFATANTVLRAAGLGYSNFQGDEVLAQEYLFGNRGILYFLLTRPKGPLQYLVTYVLNRVVLGKLSYPEAFIRLPFALAGILSVVAIYLLGARFWSRRAGLLAAFLLAASGLFLAFSRIAQYQSFIVLLSILSYYEFLGYFEDGRQSRLVAAGVLSGIALLFHYDALSFMLPMILCLGMHEVRSWRRVTGLLVYLAPMGLVSAIFYVPYVLNSKFSSTLGYLVGQRITSDFPYDSLYYSLKLLTIYHPPEFLILILIGAILLAVARVRGGNRAAALLLVLLAGLIIFRIHEVHPVTMLIDVSVLLGALLIGSLLIWGNSGTMQASADTVLTLWLLVSFTAYGLWFAKPFTHIYTFMIPLFIGLGAVLETYLKRCPAASLALVIIVGLSATSFNYQAFVNAAPEYPWNSKAYIFGRMPDALAKGEGIDGIFGFPYNRNWEEIAAHLGELGVSTYASNEKIRITMYYLRNYTWAENGYEAFIWVDKPQSLSRQEKPTRTPLVEGPNYAIFGSSPQAQPPP